MINLAFAFIIVILLVVTIVCILIVPVSVFYRQTCCVPEVTQKKS